MSELVKHQINVTRRNILKEVEGISSEVLSTIPAGFNNNIHWQVGHVLVTGELFFFPGQKNLPAEFIENFRNGSKPADWSGEVPSLEAIIEKLQEQQERINALPEEAFAQQLEKPFIGNNTSGELAAFGAFHESLHFGQIHILKRLIETTLATEAK
ncbi:DinB family protein [Lysinibacillus antri]|uniref:DinB family protein n=1 Tax=Lysinibacillus antri TaxID=2498145 RepID=A0A432L963_9BACI|nr:DinB family protein [Lysinibacillus antri]RUL49862.1 DinB family protein [Lysinibacillus antri]